MAIYNVHVCIHAYSVNTLHVYTIQCHSTLFCGQQARPRLALALLFNRATFIVDLFSQTAAVFPPQCFQISSVVFSCVPV